MKLSDYIVSFFVEKGITDVFGYPGGMVTHLMDSFHIQRERINAHLCYHEQGAAFAACGYAQTRMLPGVAYATSGPGATNLVTGIAHAYFDSCPCIFITGQVNTYEGKGDLPLRQRGFQEMEVLSLVSDITKYCVQVTDATAIRYELEKAYAIAMEGRKGPVLLDIPMDVQRTNIDASSLCSYEGNASSQMEADEVTRKIYKALSKAERPCILVGAGVSASGVGSHFRQWVNEIKVPVISSMPAVDILPNSPYYYGFIGAYGARHANMIIAKSDLIISLGSRLDLRQTGVDTTHFAVNAQLLRIDIDEHEFSKKVKPDEEDLLIDLQNLMPTLTKVKYRLDDSFDTSRWINICNELKVALHHMDDKLPNTIVNCVSKLIDSDAIVTTDVGQNQVWVAQSFVPNGQRILFSSSFGAMGYSLPAAIGAYYGSGGKKIIAFCGDGGLQMNIQELQVIARERIPVKIILLNNSSLGMIRHFQEMYFKCAFVQTKKELGYTVPNFGAISQAYEIPYARCTGIDDVNDIKPFLDDNEPAFIEIFFESDTYVFPKLAMNKVPYDQEPELERKLFDYLMNL